MYIYIYICIMCNPLDIHPQSVADALTPGWPVKIILYIYIYIYVYTYN